jgi:hypothetical protein
LPFIVLPIWLNAVVGVLAGIVPSSGTSCGGVLLTIGVLLLLFAIARQPSRSRIGKMTWCISYGAVGVIAVFHGVRWLPPLSHRFEEVASDVVSALWILVLVAHTASCVQQVLLVVMERSAVWSAYRDAAPSSSSGLRLHPTVDEDQPISIALPLHLLSGLHPYLADDIELDFFGSTHKSVTHDTHSVLLRAPQESATDLQSRSARSEMGADVAVPHRMNPMSGFSAGMPHAPPIRAKSVDTSSEDVEL